ncbi:MAG: STAS domain-containing protein [Desulfococcaceae bacterium]|jgi:anti-anti-sigma factor|nr:STAS domain-containing protein [Desulfococcaceae bacterium]
MELEIKEIKNTAVITVKGNMHADNAFELDKTLEEQIRLGKNRMILNLSELQYISSAGLGFVMKATKKLMAKNGKISIVGLHGVVEEVFKITGFYSIFSVFDTEEEALEQL